MRPGRTVWLMGGMLALGCGLAGVILPLVPTTPFLLLAAFAFARSSPRWHNWLVSHARFGPLIRDWQQHGSISVRTKIITVVVMASTWIASWLAGLGALLLATQALVMGATAIFVLSRPSGPRPQAKSCA